MARKAMPSRLQRSRSWGVRAIQGLITAGILAGSAAAQVQTVAPPVRSWLDASGVDALTGEYRLSTSELVIGQPGAGGLAHGRDWIGTAWRDHLAGTVNSSSGVYTVSLGGRSETFSESGGTFTSLQAMGSTLTADSNNFTYTLANGTVAVFSKAIANASGYTNFWSATDALITTLTKPDNEIITWTYTTGNYGGGTGRRPQSISNNLGYQIHFTYDGSDFLKRTRATGINRAYYYCADTATSCDVDGDSKAWPYVDYSVSGSTEIVTDRLSNAYRYVFSSGKMTGVRMPSSPSANNVGISYMEGADANKVYMVSVTSETWIHDYEDSGGVRTTTTSEFYHGGVTKFLSNISLQVVTEVWADSGGTRKTLYDYDSDERNTKITSPDGDYVEIEYDSRGNITEQTTAKSGSSLAPIIVSATFPSCTGSNTKTCNQPATTTAANGAVTTYAYSTTNAHGGVTKITLAEPSSGADQPETRFTYSEKYAHFKNSGGSVVAAGTSVYRLFKTSACADDEEGSSPTCVDTTKETETEITYGSSDTWVPNNRLPTIVTVRAGDDSISSATTTVYRPQGDVETVEDPLGNVTSLFYDDGRRLRATVTPDPGAGLDPRVTRITYNADGLPTTIDTGYASSAANWNSLTILHTETLTYDAVFPHSLSVSQRSMSGTIYGRTDFEYTSNGSLGCTNTRMNTSEFSGSGVVCADQPGGAYADRNLTIGYDVYNAAEIIELNGRDERWRTFADGGALETEQDAESNLTTYTQDDYRRLIRTDYPDKDTSGSDPADNAQLIYNDDGQLSGSRDRDDKWTQFCYDALGRLWKQKFTNSSSADANPSCSSPDTTFAYDNFGRVTSVTKGYHTISYVYDALGRLTRETQAGRDVDYAYNAAGWRTQMEWPDGFHVDYVYNNVGELTEIREEGQTTGAPLLAVYAYDNLGRRTSLTRGGGGTTTYGHDGGSEGPWLTDLDLNLGGSSYDISVDLTHNPAAQIVTKTTNNTSYNFTLPSDYTHTYSTNGLNQYTSVNSISHDYDARENLDEISGGSLGSFLYDEYNRLIRAPASGTQVAALTYDPVGRLFSLWPPGNDYAGYVDRYSDLLTAYNACCTGMAKSAWGLGHWTGYGQYEGRTVPPGDYAAYVDLYGDLLAAYNACCTGQSKSAWGQTHWTNNGQYESRVVPAAGTRFLYDGADIIAEYNMGGGLVRRYVHGPGIDEPLVWFEGAGYHGSGSPDRRWLYADERGSIVAVEGSSTSINTYDDFGVPGGSNLGLFQYTGQIWIPELGLYHYKARAYNPNIGRFVQPDPVGYADGMNIYNYVGGDPINATDPSGLQQVMTDEQCIQAFGVPCAEVDPDEIVPVYGNMRRSMCGFMDCALAMWISASRAWLWGAQAPQVGGSSSSAMRGGAVRDLTALERSRIPTCIAGGIDPGKIRIHNSRWSIFTNRNTVVTDGYHIYWSGAPLDTTGNVNAEALLLHEITHVWHYKYLGKTYFSFVEREYKYTLKPGDVLQRFNEEQQGAIVQDAHLLQNGQAPINTNNPPSAAVYNAVIQNCTSK